MCIVKQYIESPILLPVFIKYSLDIELHQLNSSAHPSRVFFLCKFLFPVSFNVSGKSM